MPALDATNISIVFDETEGVSGIVYGAEVSTDLVEWDPVTDTGSGTRHEFVAPGGSNPHMFMRLVISPTP